MGHTCASAPAPGHVFYTCCTHFYNRGQLPLVPSVPANGTSIYLQGPCSPVRWVGASISSIAEILMPVSYYVFSSPTPFAFASYYVIINAV
jgi:hypothetical protein